MPRVSGRVRALRWSMSLKSSGVDIENGGLQMTMEQGRSGYGFSNVLRRLDLFAKGNSSCRIFSREGVGTCISIRIPATTREDAFDRQF